jgi:hypothetical protein
MLRTPDAGMTGPGCSPDPIGICILAFTIFHIGNAPGCLEAAPADSAVPHRRHVKTVAIMQPYFFPYGGYYRLFAAADLFVLYDCVQFPRRGWVHRNRLPDANGDSRWLTLRLQHAPQQTSIGDMLCADDAATSLREELGRFPSASRVLRSGNRIESFLFDLRPRLVDYLEDTLRETCGLLNLPFRVIRSSSLAVPSELHGQDRILEIARRLGATHYVNAPGGQELYDVDAFRRSGVELRFLPPYEGSSWSALHRLAWEDAADIGREIAAQV